MMEKVNFFNRKKPPDERRSSHPLRQVASERKARKDKRQIIVLITVKDKYSINTQNKKRGVKKKCFVCHTSAHSSVSPLEHN